VNHSFNIITFAQDMSRSFFLLLITVLLGACGTPKTTVKQVNTPAITKGRTKIDTVVVSNKVEVKQEPLKEKVITEDISYSPSFAFNFSRKKYLSDILEEVKNSKKLVYLDVSASWCVPCQIMKRDVYTNKEMASWFNEKFVSHLVDVEKGEGPDLGVIYDISKFPTMLILDEKGRVLAKNEGGLTVSGLTAFVKKYVELR
jgi:thioredoxin-related protein